MSMVKNLNKTMAKQMTTPYFHSCVVFDSQVVCFNIQQLEAVLDVIEENL